MSLICTKKQANDFCQTHVKFAIDYIINSGEHLENKEFCEYVLIAAINICGNLVEQISNMDTPENLYTNMNKITKALKEWAEIRVDRIIAKKEAH